MVFAALAFGTSLSQEGNGGIERPWDANLEMETTITKNFTARHYGEGSARNRRCPLFKSHGLLKNLVTIDW
jgi:hypothetical protein